jgi:hypothetical protein
MVHEWEHDLIADRLVILAMQAERDSRLRLAAALYRAAGTIFAAIARDASDPGARDYAALCRKWARKAIGGDNE